jgi:CheY-like chemotaxis protein
LTSILVVDDEPDMRRLVCAVIDMANDGLQVVAEATDGAEAMTIWRGLDGPPQPDVVILDNRMPHASGVEVAREILRERPDQLVVLHSAYLDDGIRAEAISVGIAVCVPKADVFTLPTSRALTQTGFGIGPAHRQIGAVGSGPSATGQS